MRISFCLGIASVFVCATIAVAQDSELEKHHQKYLRDHTDPAGRVRPDLLLKGIEYVKHMQVTAGIPVSKPNEAASPGGSSSRMKPRITNGITGVQWTGIGPAGLIIDSNKAVDGAGPTSGEVVDIAIDPRGTTDQVIYIATNDGGVWKSSDGGTSWNSTMDFMPSLSIGAVALDPNNPSIVYAGTGDIFDGAGRYCCNGSTNLKAIGIYKSVDAGNTWLYLNPDGIFTGVQMNRIVVLPSNSNVVLLATTNGLFRSKDGGQHFGSAPNFSDGLPILAPGTTISDLKVDTANGSTVLAGVTGVGILESTDGGVTFPTNVFPGTGAGAALLTDAISAVTFAQSTSPNNQTIYAMVSSATVKSGNNFKLEGLYKSIDGGGTWSQILPYDWPTTVSAGAQLSYDQSVGVDPQNPNLIYFGIVGMWGATDGGATILSFSGVGDSQIHNDHHAMTFSPKNHWSGPTTAIYDGSDGGIATSADGGSTWTNINKGLATNLFFTMSMGLGTAGNSNQYMYGALQDQGNPDHRPTMAPLEWHLNTGGDGFSVAADVTPGNGANAYGRYNNTTQFTPDGGMTWTAQTLVGLTQGVQNMFIDPNDGTAVYTTQGNQICRGSHSGSTITFSCFPSGGFSANTNQVATAQIDSNTLWVGLANGKVARVDNATTATPSVTEYTIPGVTTACGGTCGVRGLAMDPTNTTTVVVVYPGFTDLPPTSSTRHVFMTTDNGNSWTDITGSAGGTQNLPDLPLNSVVIDPAPTPHAIIVASDVAVLRSADLGQTWQVFGVGFPTVLATDLHLDTTVTPSLLRVSTYGRSVFELTAATGPLIAVNANLAFGITCAGAPATNTIQIFNVGSTDLHISSITRVSGSSDFSIASGPPPPVTVPPGSEIDYTVQFNPTGPGIETAVFQINSDDPFHPAEQLFASGTAGAASINATLVSSGNFGNVCPGSQANLSLEITNQGTCNLVVSTIISSNANFLTPSVGLPLVLSADATVSLPITFQPAGSVCSNTTDTRTGMITITSNDPATPSLIESVQGTVPCPQINATIANSGSFGNVCAGNQQDLTLQVLNQGMCNLTVSNISLSDTADFVLPTVQLPLVLSADANASLPIRFKPTGGVCSSTVPRTSTVTITSNDPTHPTFAPVADVSGIEGCPQMVLSPQNLTGLYAFPATVSDPTGNLGCYTDRKITIANSGICPLNITSLTAGPSNTFNVINPTVPLSIAPGAAPVPVTVRFKPTNLTGQNSSAPDQQTGTLAITSNDPVVADNSANLCGEPTYHSGVRVLVVNASGTPINPLKSLSLSSQGLHPNISETLDPAIPQTALNICGNTITYTLDNETLPPAGTTGSNPKASYSLSAKQGSTQANMSFTLGQCEFKQLVMQVK